VPDEFQQDPDEPSEPFERHETSSDSLSGELAEVVRNDPDAAVHVLRTWIGNAS
jgi:flagellar biosynthesis/type III secretory pathway M-ring protein FliF/YscJ